MAKGKRATVLSALIEHAQATQPANPAPSTADTNYLVGLKKRVFTEAEITSIALKVGMKIDAAFFAKAAEKAKKAAETREKNKAKKSAAPAPALAPVAALVQAR